jgi:hypothetical protein
MRAVGVKLKQSHPRLPVRTLEILKPLIIKDARFLFDGRWRLRLVWMKLGVIGWLGEKRIWEPWGCNVTLDGSGYFVGIIITMLITGGVYKSLCSPSPCYFCQVLIFQVFLR